MSAAFTMDVTDELEARASTVHGGAYAVMMKARKEILRLRRALAAAAPSDAAQIRIAELEGALTLAEERLYHLAPQPISITLENNHASHSSAH